MQEMKSVKLTDALFAYRAHTKALLFLAAVCFLFPGTIPAAAQAGKRIILKDGSWQGITKYEVQGERTRYFSSQRWEWEEVPRDLVDWKATKEWNERKMQLPPEEDEPSRKADSTDALTVAPGLRLSSPGGVFILDTFSGEPSLVELTQEPGVLSHESSGIFHSGIGSKASFKQRFELRGEHARTQAHVPVPRIFIKIAEADEEPKIAPIDRFRIVRLEPEKNSRVLANVDVTITGQQSQTQQFEPFRIETFSEGWLKIIPLKGLIPGEYALVEMLDQGRFNSYAWDFGVNPHAPFNARSQRPDPALKDNAKTLQPELEPREK